jgi:hypothetical protein
LPLKATFSRTTPSSFDRSQKAGKKRCLSFSIDIERYKCDFQDFCEVVTEQKGILRERGEKQRETAE